MSQLSQVLEQVRLAGYTGRTADEISDLTGILSHTVNIRLCALKNENLVYKTNEKRRTRSGMSAYVWVDIIEAGKKRKLAPEKDWKKTTFGDLIKMCGLNGITIVQEGMSWEIALGGGRHVSAPLFTDALQKLSERIRDDRRKK